ncbi:hypothetical protein KIM372_14720 [Bombiscardovia nodaiensis]|uniref:Sortase n=1 Tax=Bombiscardovia nodaiensis TaxID=2932181 RepID=A0ABM8BAF8_9BIFI|nr:hypothetical protein KIM372_14720 [Bombiscardovia nodaiensis]
MQHKRPKARRYRQAAHSASQPSASQPRHISQPSASSHTRQSPENSRKHKRRRIRNNSRLSPQASRRLTTAVGLVSLICLLLAYASWSYFVVAQQVSALNRQQASAAYGQSIRGKSPAQLAADQQTIDAYNRALKAQYNRDPFLTSSYEIPEGYQQLQALTGSPVLGQLFIPSISLSEPIYFGDGHSAPDKQVEHLASTPLPSNLEGMNTVLAGHSGLSNAVIFDHLDQVQTGDHIRIQVLDRELTYQVNRIRIVSPKQVDALQARQGSSQVTLVTCWPRYVNDKRLIVQGSLVSTQTLKPGQLQSPAQVDRRMYAVVLIGLLLSIGATALAARSWRRAARKHLARKPALYLATFFLAALASLVLLWLLLGLLASSHLVNFDLGYPWFNAHLLRLFSL